MIRRYEPDCTLGELRNMKRRSDRTNYPTYLMVPDDQTMISIFEKLALLNGEVKHKECIIRKTPFYNLKGRTIIYFLTICKAGLRPGWSYKFNGLQESPEIQIHNKPQVLAAIELIVGGLSFKFHVPVGDPLMCVIFDEIYQAEMLPFKTDNPPRIDAISTISIWGQLLSIYEDNCWFIYEQALVNQWLDYMKVWYPHLKLKIAGGIHPKLSTLINGGPMIQMNGSDLCKFDKLKYNFNKILAEHDQTHSFSFVIKDSK